MFRRFLLTVVILFLTASARAEPPSIPSLTGLWMNSEKGLIIMIEDSPFGLVMHEANPKDRYSRVGDVIGQARPGQAPGEYIGRHIWGGSKTPSTTWGADGGLVIRWLVDDRLFVQFRDSKYQGGWVYSRAW